MTKKNYIALAEALIEARNGVPPSFNLKEAEAVLALVTKEVAVVLARDSANFDTQRFIRAAIMGEWTNNAGHRQRRK